MPKKQVELEKEYNEAMKEEVKIEPKKIVSKIDLSFPNEDLNKLVSKVNEIIENL